MPDERRVRCVNCRKHRDVVGPISWAGLCNGCGKLRATENLEDLVTHSGPWFTHWRRSIAASVGATLLDAEHAGGQSVERAS